MNQISTKAQTLQSVNTSNTMTPADLLSIAVKNDADIDKLEKLMHMKQVWDANEAKKAYVRAMSKFRSLCPAIEKTKQVKYNGTSYSHPGLAESIEQIKEMLAECGLSHSWRTSQANSIITVTCILTHVDGHSDSTSLESSPDKSGGKNNIQAIGSAVAYLERYTFFAILGLASKDMDDDGRGTSSTPTYETRKPTPKARNIVSRLVLKKLQRVEEIIKANDELRFYLYLKHTNESDQKQIAARISNKQLYSKIENKAKDIVKIYSDDIEGYALRGDLIKVAELINEIKPHRALYESVYNALSKNCKAEIENSIQE